MWLLTIVLLMPTNSANVSLLIKQSISFFVNESICRNIILAVQQTSLFSKICIGIHIPFTSLSISICVCLIKDGMFLLKTFHSLRTNLDIHKILFWCCILIAQFFSALHGF